MTHYHVIGIAAEQGVTIYVYIGLHTGIITIPKRRGVCQTRIVVLTHRCIVRMKCRSCTSAKVVESKREMY